MRVRLRVRFGLLSSRKKYRYCASRISNSTWKLWSCARSSPLLSLVSFEFVGEPDGRKNTGIIIPIGGELIPVICSELIPGFVCVFLEREREREREMRCHFVFLLFVHFHNLT